MAQFGGKNPPWAREVVGQPGVTMVGNLQQQVLSQPGVANPVYNLNPQPAQHQFSVQQATMQLQAGQFQQQMSQLQQQQQHMSQPSLATTMASNQIGNSFQASMQAAAALQQSVQLPQPGIAIPTTLATTQVATVSYPTPRAAAQGPQPKQRVFTGTVTKLHDNFGFVDEDVFFQTSCVKGTVPKVGDRVLVEAAYNANMPFKWNATRIQVLPNQPPPGSNPPNTTMNQNRGAQMQAMAGNIQGGGPPPLMGNAPHGGGSKWQDNRQGGPPHHRGDNDRNYNLAGPPGGGRRDRGGDRDFGGRQDRGRDRGNHDRQSSRDDHDRGHRNTERRSPARRRSRSPRRRSRSPSRTARSPPRRSRNAPRVVPRYTVQIPKLSLDTKEANVITLKSRYTNMYVPSDFFNAAFSWTDAFPLHRPLQLGNQCSFHVMHKEVDPIEKFDAVLEPPDADHLYSAKVMLMSCPIMEELYHKSCALAEDSPEMKESFQHPTRLVQFLVGLKGKSEPMAIGGPWSPSLDGPGPAEDPRVLINTAIRTTKALTGIDLSVCTQWYRFAEIRYHRPEEVHKGRVVPARVETVVLFLPDVWSANPSRLEWEQMTQSFKQQLADKIKADAGADSKDDNQEEEDEGEEGSEEKKDPSHFSELDPKTMKVNDLRKELEARTLSSKGLKSQLIARLTKALKGEQEKEEQEAENKDEEEEKPAEVEEKTEPDDKEEERKRREEEEKKRRDERERAARERRYNLPDNPAILVHPSTTAKGGKFDCTVMSLSVLLDYRPDDNKEHTFEVSLFAELFNEMLMRDCGFLIYKSLLSAPEKPKEEKKKKDEKKDEKKDDKKEDKKDEKDEKKDDKDEKDKKEEKKDSEEEEPPAKKRKSESEDSAEKEDTKDDKKESKEKTKKEEEKEEEASDNEDDSKSTVSERKDRRRSKEKDKEKKKDKLKYHTADPNLLLAFCYFDQSHTGYLMDKDVEEILHTIGLHLSRAQVKKLVQRLVTRDTLNYRKITDKPLPDKKEEEKKEGDEEEKMELDDETGTPDEEKSEDAVLPDDETLAQGNRPLLSTPKKEPAPLTTTTTQRTSGRRGKKEEESPTTASGMVMYKGSMLDINSVMHRLDKSEKTKRDTEAKLKDTQEEIEMLKSSFTSSEQNSQKVALELQELKKKLRDQRKATERAEGDAKKYYDVLNRSKGPLNTVLHDIKETLGGGDVKTEDVKVKTEVNGE